MSGLSSTINIRFTKWLETLLDDSYVTLPVRLTIKSYFKDIYAIYMQSVRRTAAVIMLWTSILEVQVLTIKILISRKYHANLIVIKCSMLEFCCVFEEINFSLIDKY